MRWAAFGFCVLLPFAALAEPPPELEGYRLDRYRAPVPASLSGATVVTTKEVEAIFRSDDALFIDVLPRPPRPKGLKADAIWRPRPRHNIPGSHWLPNVGLGVLPVEVETYFQESLARLTQGDKASELLFYCLADCWMSWNAAKRALAYGYSEVTWYPDGTDGWSAAGLPLEKSEPVAAIPPIPSAP